MHSYCSENEMVTDRWASSSCFQGQFCEEKMKTMETLIHPLVPELFPRPLAFISFRTAPNHRFLLIVI